MADVQCEACGASLKPGAKFCRKCGAKPSAGGAGDQVACYACQEQNVAGYKSCKGCGAPPPKPTGSKKASEKKTEPASVSGAAAKKPCQMCGFRNEGDYETCVKCGEPNAARKKVDKKKQEAEAAASAKKKLQSSGKGSGNSSSSPSSASNSQAAAASAAQEDLLKGVEFKTKAKGGQETSGLKVGDLAVGMRVWVTVGGDEGWLPAQVTAVGKDSVTVSHEGDGSSVQYKLSDVFIRNPPNLDGVSDLTQLSYMHEPGLLYILSERYANKQIYTFTGQTLIAVNPYARLPIYDKETLNSYVGQPLGRMPPHIFAVAEDAFRAMMDFNEPQSVLVSGESGAGKTESVKVLLQYLAAMGSLGTGAGAGSGGGGGGGGGGTGGGGAGGSTSGSGLSESDGISAKKKGGSGMAAGGTVSVEQQVLQSNPVLEAFGNAKTLRNDNSSRFGKFIRIQFSERGQIEGAEVLTYLLEKPRLTAQIEGERNFHIFYQLCKGASAVEKKQLALKEPSEYHYLNQGKCYDVPSVDDAKEFEVLRDALKIFGVDAEIQKALWRYLAGILELGNITFKKEEIGDRDDATLDNGKPLAYAAKLLGLPQDAIKKSLLRRQAKMGKNMVTIRLKVEEAETARDAFAMLLYGRLFDHLVKLINDGLRANTSGSMEDSENSRFIGVLDIYGFEFFEKNSFEQLCINWANEKLQQQFNQHIFKLEQAEYIKEKIDWNYIEFADNQPILSLIEDKQPLGIIGILDEQCRFPKSDHLTFAEKMFQDFAKHPHFEKPKFSKTAFTIDHYAGKVTYDTQLFLDKNRDYLIPEQFIILGESEEEFVKSIFAEAAAEYKESGGSMKFASVGSAFKQSLANLMSVINRTQTHYIRCIKPNDKKKPGLFQKPMSLHQLRCGGVLETMRIAAAGFPTRWSYEKFCERYRILAPLIFDQLNGKWKECAAELVKKIGLEANQFQMGLSKVFLRAGLVAHFEELLKRKLDEAAIRIQKWVRMFVKRKQFLRMKRNAAVVQQQVRRLLARHLLESLRMRLCSILLQSHLRAFVMVRKYKRLRKAAMLVQRKIRGGNMMAALRRLLQESREQKAREQRQVSLVVRCQAVIRMKNQRRKFRVVRAEARDVVGKFQKVTEEKSLLEKKVEELTWRLTAENRTKLKLQEEKADLEERLKKESEEAEALRKELKAVKKVAEEGQKKLSDSQAKREELAAKLQASEKATTALEEVVTKLKSDLEESKVNKVDQEKIMAQSQRIAELELEVKNFARLLEEEKLRASEITESVMSLTAHEVDVLQSKIQGAYGFVPPESYLGLVEETNSPAVMITRQQLETLVRMTAKKTKDEGVFSLIDFLLSRVNQGFNNGDCPTLGFALVHVINHFDCLRRDREDIFNHIIQGIEVEIPELALSNERLAYCFNSVLFLLHSTDQQLLLAGVEDPWYTDVISMDGDMNSRNKLAPDQQLPNTIKFLYKLRHLVSQLFMELVFNVEEILEPLLRGCVAGVVSGVSAPKARSSFQAVLDELQRAVGLARVFFWPRDVLVALVRQLLFFVNAFLVNCVLAQKQLCNRTSAGVMSQWLEDLERWVQEVHPHVAVSNSMEQMARFRQVLDLLLSDMSQFATKATDATRKMFPDLLSGQVKQLLTHYSSLNEGSDSVPSRAIRNLTKGREDGELLIDKTLLFPLSVKVLQEISFAELATLPFPANIGKLLAEEMASLDVIDDEYVVVNVDLDVFEIGDEMLDVELEADSDVWDEGDLQDLDEETRQRLMLAYDDLDRSKSSVRLPSRNSSRPSAAALFEEGPVAEPAATTAVGSSTSQDAIRDKVAARMEAKKREKEEEERRKKEEEIKAALNVGDDDLLDFAWQVGDSCEAIFIDDGLWYEAEIIDGPNKEGEFLVTFTEYGNDQWCPPALLRLSPEMLALLAPESNGDEQGLPMESAIFGDDNDPAESTIFGDDVSLIEASEDPFD